MSLAFFSCATLWHIHEAYHRDSFVPYACGIALMWSLLVASCFTMQVRNWVFMLSLAMFYRHPIALSQLSQAVALGGFVQGVACNGVSAVFIRR